MGLCFSGEEVMMDLCHRAQTCLSESLESARRMRTLLALSAAAPENLSLISSMIICIQATCIAADRTIPSHLCIIDSGCCFNLQRALNRVRR